MYPATVVNFNFGHPIDVALDIAMDYLERTGQATDYCETQSKVKSAIIGGWRNGVSHHIRLANIGIKAVEHQSFVNFQKRA
jgi:hypothetical protein